MFGRAESPTLLDITVVHIAVYLLIPVLLGNNRLRAFISASFAFSIINLTHLPIMHFIFFIVSPFINSLSYVEFLQQYPQIYYGGIFLNNIVITVCCLFAARWQRETKIKPPLTIYILFNLLFILFPVAILAWYENILSVITVSFLSSGIICVFFIGILLFLFYLYTRLASVSQTDDAKTINPPPLTAPEPGEYTRFIQYLSKRELEVVKMILTGKESYKELSAALNISVHTVKAHLKNIYRTTGVSNVAALSSLFRGFAAPHYP